MRMGDVGFRILTRSAAITVLALLGAVILSLIDGSLPALRAFGLNFLIEQRWNPVTERFGALAPIYGTLVTSIIAMVIAVPLGLLIARSCSTARISCRRSRISIFCAPGWAWCFRKPTPFPMSLYENIAFGVRLYDRTTNSELDGRVELALRKLFLMA